MHTHRNISAHKIAHSTFSILTLAHAVIDCMRLVRIWERVINHNTPLFAILFWCCFCFLIKNVNRGPVCCASRCKCTIKL